MQTAPHCPLPGFSEAPSFPANVRIVAAWIVGLCGGVFNVFGNVASIVTPLVIGYMVKELYSFNGALVFVGCSALMMMVCYLFVAGDIKRMELKK
ncbi:MAG: transporter, phthalate permease family [Proteobacteria bacterium]|nr:transporter, phthalate permease family [Pseudomonadota bacterium]